MLWKAKGYTIREIKKRLEEECVRVSRRALFSLLTRYFIAELPRATKPRKLSQEQYSFINCGMAENDELTGRQLHEMIEDRWLRTKVSLSTVI